MSGSAIFDSFFNQLLFGGINLATDKFSVLLVDETYKMDQNHSRRSEIQAYAAKGAEPEATGAEVLNERGGFGVKFSGAKFPTDHVRPAGAIYYQDNGAADLDVLVAFHSFGRIIESKGGGHVVVAPFELHIGTD
jgi:hypothetical protein